MTSPTGKLFPSKKGISMSLDKYKKMTNEVEKKEIEIVMF